MTPLTTGVDRCPSALAATKARYAIDFRKVMLRLNAKGITCLEVARRLGMSSGTVQRWKNGKQPAPIKHWEGQALLALFDDFVGEPHPMLHAQVRVADRADTFNARHFGTNTN